MAKKSDYGADSIDIYKGLEGVRKKPAMYIGVPDKGGIFHIFKELIDNAIDEALNGHNDVVGAVVEKDGTTWVFDQGRGIPVEIHKKTKKSTLTGIFTTLHAGGKMRGGKAGSSYGASVGCFIGDTKIQLLDGRKVPIKRLHKRFQKNDEKFWVYAYNEESGEKFFPRLCTGVYHTRTVDKIAKVKLDNGKVIKCTVDHPFMLRNGEYKEAQELVSGTSLMSLNLRSDVDGYTVYYDPNSPSGNGRVHRTVMRCLGDNPEDMEVHHQNKDKSDNRPENLQVVSYREHSDIEPERHDGLRNWARSTENSERASEWAKEWNSNSQYLSWYGKVQKICARAYRDYGKVNKITYNKSMFHGAPKWENILAYFGEKELKKIGKSYLKEFGRNGKTYNGSNDLDYETGLSNNSMVLDHSEDMIKKRMQGRILSTIKSMQESGIRVSRGNYEEYKKGGCPSWQNINKYFPELTYRQVIECAKDYNHKVVEVEIEELDEPQPVYGMTVEGDHNYLLGAGVFVKNTHGVGASVTNALSEFFEVYTHRDGKWYKQGFKKGKPVTEVEKTGAPKIPFLQPKYGNPKKGTVIRYKPDKKCFEKGSKLPKDMAVELFDTSSFLHPKTKFVWATYKKKQTVYHQPEGLKAFTKQLLNEQKASAVGKPFVYQDDFVDVSIQWSSHSDEIIDSFVNGSATSEGGTHVQGLSQAIVEAIKPFKTQKSSYRAEDLRNGLLGGINVKLASPSFDSQTKDKLITKDAQQEVYKRIMPELKKFFNNNKTLAKNIIKRANDIRSAQAQLQVEKKAAAQLKVSSKGKTWLPSDKLTRAQTKDPKQRELFLVEGDSAGGTAKRARDPYTQEVLALKGKIINAYKDKGKMFNNQEIQDILKSIGYDPSLKDPLSRLRVGKVILLSDADPDGQHINLLILSLLHKVMPQLFDRKMVYVVDSMLYTYQKGNKRYYGSSVEHLRQQVKNLDPNYVTRIKGWGEVNQEVLSEIAFDHESRKLVKIEPVTGKEKTRFINIVGENVSTRKQLLDIG